MPEKDKQVGYYETRKFILYPAKPIATPFLVLCYYAVVLFVLSNAFQWVMTLILYKEFDRVSLCTMFLMMIAKEIYYNSLSWFQCTEVAFHFTAPHQIRNFTVKEWGILGFVKKRYAVSHVQCIMQSDDGFMLSGDIRCRKRKGFRTESQCKIQGVCREHKEPDDTELILALIEVMCPTAKIDDLKYRRNL